MRPLIATESIRESTVVLGPEEWGWPGYFFSGYDQQWADAHGWSSFLIAMHTEVVNTFHICSSR
jgi:hypothetical protein